MAVVQLNEEFYRKIDVYISGSFCCFRVTDVSGSRSNFNASNLDFTLLEIWKVIATHETWVGAFQTFHDIIRHACIAKQGIQLFGATFV